MVYSTVYYTQRTPAYAITVQTTSPAAKRRSSRAREGSPRVAKLVTAPARVVVTAGRGDEAEIESGGDRAREGRWRTRGGRRRRVECGDRGR